MDAQRTVAGYDRMAEAYVEDAESNPMNASYERPAMLSMAGEIGGRCRLLRDSNFAVPGCTLHARAQEASHP
jgi:hypothetical protein